jgi:hypothetical protein
LVLSSKPSHVAVCAAVRIERHRTVDVPAQPLAGPLEDGVIGAAGHDLEGEVGHGEVGAGAGGTLQQAAVAGDRPGVVAMMVEGMQVAAATDHPHQQPFTGKHAWHGTL